jgi:putative NIF3 family GTP cyclohydrolase 1 type 2
LSSETWDPDTVTAETAEILAYLDDLLDPGAFEDYGPNGLQVPGAARVSTVVTGVSGQLELFARAADLGAQLVLVHHGILWDFQPRRMSHEQAARLRTLLCAGIALAAYHLPLDAHPVLGNNALLAQQLGCVDPAPFGIHRGRAIGVAGRFAGEGLSADELVRRVRKLTGHEPLLLGAGPERVRSIRGDRARS